MNILTSVKRIDKETLMTKFDIEEMEMIEQGIWLLEKEWTFAMTASECMDIKQLKDKIKSIIKEVKGMTTLQEQMEELKSLCKQEQLHLSMCKRHVQESELRLTDLLNKYNALEREFEDKEKNPL